MSTSEWQAVVSLIMKYFAAKDSIVREIWGKGDTILFVFAGASAEFALNKAVDWLYFTGRLPADPLGRLFSTVSYAKQIIFAEEEAAYRAIDKITSIHSAIESARGYSIPDWAYRDVLFLLIDYSISSFEVLERKLTDAEKEEVFHIFYRVGLRMGLKELPKNYKEWLPVRAEHLACDLAYSHYTADLYKQYKKHLGLVRFTLLTEAQKIVCPEKVQQLLGFNTLRLLRPVLAVYKLTRSLKMDGILKSVILPPKYKREIKRLDAVTSAS